MIDIQPLQPADLLPKIQKLWDASAPKILAIDKDCTAEDASPVHTVQGRYTAKGWTDWTRGFQHGSAILQFDATGDESFLTLGRDRTLETMAGHLTHIGVHDHGFNNVSTYGNLLRLNARGPHHRRPVQQKFYEMALKVSGAVQAAALDPHRGRHGLHLLVQRPAVPVQRHHPLLPLALLAHSPGPLLFGEQDEKINLLGRAIEHATNTAKYNVYYGEGRDTTTCRGRVGARSDLQRDQRPLPLPLVRSRAIRRSRPGPAGCPGPGRLRRAARVASHPRTRSSPRSAGAGSSRLPQGARPSATSISRTPPPTASRTGTRAPPTCTSSATTSTSPPTRTTTTSRSTPPPPPSALRA